jgi:hypothetical protein
MGLDVSHDCWIGAYSAFGTWRNELAEVAGYKIVPGDLGFPVPEIWFHEQWTKENWQGEWPDGLPEDPLLVLLIHSDCDGIIPVKAAPFLAERLEQLLPKLPEVDAPGHIGNWREKTQWFIDGLRAAADEGEDVEFG